MTDGDASAAPPPAAADAAAAAPTAELPPGFFRGDDNVAAAPRAAVRVSRSEFSAEKTVTLVACAHLQAGDTILVERPLLQWNPDLDTLLTSARMASTEAEKLLLTRCAAIKKMSGQMASLTPFCSEVLPVLHAACAKSRGAPLARDEVWASPYSMADSKMSVDQMKLKAAFCVLSQKGLSKTPFEATVPDHQTLARLCVIAERSAIEAPAGRAVFRYTSHARTMAYVKPKLVSVGARPGTRRAKEPEAPKPNSDYDIDAETGVLVLRAKRAIRFGEAITVPRDKVWAREESAAEVLRNKEKMREAVIHKAKEKDAPEGVKHFAKQQHPPVRPFLPAAEDASLVRKRNVANELWAEACEDGVTTAEKPLVLSVDYVFNDAECALLCGGLARGGTEQRIPFHIGFEVNSRVVAGGLFAGVAQHLIGRTLSKIPRVYNGLSLTGSAATGVFFRLTPGEEILEFPMKAEGLLPHQTALPFFLCLTDAGKVTFNKGKFTVKAKRGRVCVWAPGHTHRVPVCTEGDVALLFSYMIYQDPSKSQNKPAAAEGELA
eukprot:Rhum_TRINITY_DN1275_c0_g1::Rhum_TRINITY_DN1275_c0_g1_i1::g.3866::m.3866